MRYVELGFQVYIPGAVSGHNAHVNRTDPKVRCPQKVAYMLRKGTVVTAQALVMGSGIQKIAAELRGNAS